MELLKDMQKIEKEVDKQFSSLEKQIGYLYHSQFEKNYKTICWDFAKIDRYGRKGISHIMGLILVILLPALCSFFTSYILYALSVIPVFFLFWGIWYYFQYIELTKRLRFIKKQSCFLLPRLKKNLIQIKLLTNMVDLEIAEEIDDKFTRELERIKKFDKILELYTLIDFKNTPSGISQNLPDDRIVFDFMDSFNQLKFLNEKMEQVLNSKYIINIPSVKEIIEGEESKKYQIIGEESRDKILKWLKLIGEAQYSVKPILPYKEQLKMQSQIETNQATQKFIVQH